MARRYETVYILDSALEEPAINEKLERFHALITKDGKGTVTNIAHWGKRTLAYPIKKRQSGYYVVALHEAQGGGPAQFARLVKLDESVLRFLVVVNEGEPVKPIVAAPIVADLDEIIEEEEEV